MSFSDAIKTCLKDKYCCFEGRARRSEYWFFYLFNFICAFIAQALNKVADNQVFTVIVSLAVLLPGLGVSVRRLHDVGKSGWYLLMSLIPFVGAILVLVKLCTDGIDGPNQYGPDPKVEGSYAQQGYTSAYANPHEQPGSADRYQTHNNYSDEITRAVESKYCVYCGSKLAPGQKFCNNCGAKVE